MSGSYNKIKLINLHHKKTNMMIENIKTEGLVHFQSVTLLSDLIETEA